MIHLSKGFRKLLADDVRDYSARAEIVLEDSTRIDVSPTEIWSDGFNVEDAVSDDEAFTALGATVINAATLTLDNTKDIYTDYDFKNADVKMYISAQVPDTVNGEEITRTEEVKMGTFRVDDTAYNEATISLSMLDYMEQFDRPYSRSTLTYPATLGQIVRDACQECSVTLNTLTFPHDDFIVQTRPTDDALTFREVISWCATIAGCFARCNRNGELEIKWFNTSALENDTGTDGGEFDAGSPYYSTGANVDGGTFSPWSTGAEVDGGNFTDEIPLHYIGKLYSQSICVDETVITGVEATVEDNESDEKQTQVYSAGTDGYKIQISGNKFLNKDNAQTVVDWLGQQLIGLRFRKCSVTHADDPSIEAGDVGLLYDAKQREYPILITRHAFDISGPQAIVCGSDTPAHNSAARFSQATKNEVEIRKKLKEQKSTYELEMQRLAEDIEANAHGLYVDEIEDPDNPGAMIRCLHDKPALNDSDVRIHISDLGIFVTNNGTAQTPLWYGWRVNGDAIARIMNTLGINFDWGVGGELTIKKGDNEVFYADADTGIVRITSKKDNQTVFYLDTQTGTVNIVANQFSLSSGDTIQDIADTAANTKLQDFITKTYSTDIQEINSQVDKKAETWYQASVPSTSWTSEEKAEHIGDLWYCTGATGDYKKNQTYRWNGTTWVKQSAPDEVFDKIDGKAQIFTAQPVPPYNKGDLWFNSSSSDIMTCVNARTSGSYTASDWEKRNKYTDDSEVTRLNNSLTQQEIFNRLTNNQNNQGVYLYNGKLYLNFEYAVGQTLKLGGNNNSYGLLEVRDASDNPIGSWSKDGINASGDFAMQKKISNKIMKSYLGEFYYRIYNIVEGRSWRETGNGFCVIYNQGALPNRFSISTAGGIVWERNMSGNQANVQDMFGGSLQAVVHDSYRDFVFDVGISNGIYIHHSRYTKPTADDAEAKYESTGFTLRFTNDGIYHNYESSGGWVAFQSSSSRRYKHDIKPIEEEQLDPHKLLQLRAVQFVFNDDHIVPYADMHGQTIPGFIAEEVAEIYPAAAIHDNRTGQVENWDERRIIPGMLALIQEQDKKLKEQEAEINAMKEKVARLEEAVNKLLGKEE